MTTRIDRGLVSHASRLIALSTALSLAPVAAAGERSGNAIRVLTLDVSRTDVCGELDYNIVAGNFFEELRAALADAANFGEAGTVPRPVELAPAVERITGTALEGIDVVLLSVMAVPLDACERGFLRSFVQQGGGVLAFHNNAAIEVGPVFEANGRSGIRGGTGVLMARQAAIAKGPFGAVARNTPLMWHRIFDSLGRNGVEVIRSTGGGPWCASFTLGAGRGVLACDEEWIGSAVDQGCAVANLDDNKLVLFLNSFAHVTPSESFAYARVAALVGDVNDDCIVDGADLGLLRSLWGSDSPLADLNGDGVVDGADLGLLLANWS